MKYTLFFTKQAQKDTALLSITRKDKLRYICETLLMKDPYLGKKLLGELQGYYSLRLSLKDRIVYTIDEDPKIVYIHRTKTHYSGQMG